ncbi:MAG: 50S ribosomal protein L11 methyltransferase [Gammaproteobacteria bacterium]|nr:50S ribosomal protein L11 methyltransferase [Gammaproteobacteria bacterium]
MWLQLSLPAGDADPQSVADAFTALGALSVTLQDAADQPLFEPPPGATPLWSQVRVTALFEAGADIARIKSALAGRFGADCVARLQIEPLDDRDWVRAWMDGYAPMRFGEKLWIVPTGFEAPDPDGVNLLLDPGLAFGTGTHPTTALCLEWLDAHPPVDQVVVDYGCGSGILGIAALKLGAREVWAVDNDPQALMATLDNAERNGVADRVKTCLPQQFSGLFSGVQADLLLANILANPLIELAPRFAGLVHPGADLVLSGILAEQAESVSVAYRERFAMQAPVQHEDWVRLAGTRRKT